MQLSRLLDTDVQLDLPSLLPQAPETKPSLGKSDSSELARVRERNRQASMCTLRRCLAVSLSTGCMQAQKRFRNRQREQLADSQQALQELQDRMANLAAEKEQASPTEKSPRTMLVASRRSHVLVACRLPCVQQCWQRSCA